MKNSKKILIICSSIEIYSNWTLTPFYLWTFNTFSFKCHLKFHLHAVNSLCFALSLTASEITAILKKCLIFDLPWALSHTWLVAQGHLKIGIIYIHLFRPAKFQEITLVFDLSRLQMTYGEQVGIVFTSWTRHNKAKTSISQDKSGDIINIEHSIFTVNCHWLS